MVLDCTYRVRDALANIYSPAQREMQRTGRATRSPYAPRRSVGVAQFSAIASSVARVRSSVTPFILHTANAAGDVGAGKGKKKNI